MKSKKKKDIELHHTITSEDGYSRDLATTVTGDRIYIEAKGYGVACMESDTPIGGGSQAIVCIESWGDELRVIVWSDINQEDPEYIINCEGAKLDCHLDA
jgi:hypothetical protein